MKIDNVLASMAVRDLNLAMKWYSCLFGRAPDAQPMSEVAEWKFARGGWLQIYALPDRAGHGSCTLAVDDLGSVILHVQALGIDVSQRTSTAQVKTLMITDPDGNHLAFAEALTAEMAR